MARRAIERPPSGSNSAAWIGLTTERDEVRLFVGR